jgi:hypothetical protein
MERTFYLAVPFLFPGLQDYDFKTIFIGKPLELGIDPDLSRSDMLSHGGHIVIGDDFGNG